MLGERKNENIINMNSFKIINISGKLSDLVKDLPKSTNLENYDSLLLTLYQKPIIRQGKIVGVITGLDVTNDYWEGIIYAKLLPSLSMDNCFCEVVLKDIY